MSTLLLTDPAKPGCVIKHHSRTRTRLSARLRTHDLDRALAAGVSPDSSAVLSLRAHTLIGARTRDGFARSIRTLIADAQRPHGPLVPGVPICRRKVLGSRKSFEDLAERLVQRDPVDARGVARVALLLTDGRGPVYDQPAADDLEPAIEQARHALELAV